MWFRIGFRRRLVACGAISLAVTLAAQTSAGAQTVNPDPGRDVESSDVAGLTSDQVLRLEARLLAERIGSSVAEAEGMLVLQGELGDLREALVFEKPDTFAGSWIEYNPYRVKIAFTVDAATEVEAIRRVFSKPEVIEAVTANHSLRDLREAKAYLVDAVFAADPKTAGLAHLDEKSLLPELQEHRNRILVRTTDPLAVQQFLANSQFAEMVTVEEGGPFEFTAQGTIQGGLKGLPSSCTVGFVIKKVNSIEAGIVYPAERHCATPTSILRFTTPLGPRLQNGDQDQPTPLDSQWVGLADRDWLPRNRVMTGWEPWEWMEITSRTDYWHVSQGNWVCKFGQTTGRTCGTVQSTSTGLGDWITADYVQDYGDSGGPVTYGNSAVGTHRGLIGVGGGVVFAFFGSISFWEQAWGVEVATSPLAVPGLEWHLRNTHSTGAADRLWEYGDHVAVRGDWLGDGRDQPGQFYSFWDVEGEPVTYYGYVSDTPVVGKWDSWAQRDHFGVYRPSEGRFYLRHTFGVTLTLYYGNPGDVPLAGDWDGGNDDVGVFRPSEARFYLRNSNGTTTAVYFGAIGDQPLVGDWNGDGIDTIGVYRPSTGQVFLRNTNSDGPADYQFYYGNQWETAMTGDWDGDGVDTIAVIR